MKNSIAIIAGLALMGAAQGFAANQATVALNNYGAAAGVINYQATEGGATTLLPADAWIEVLGGAPGALTSLGAAFHPSEPGYFDSGVVLVPGAAAGQTGSFEVRAWTGAATYDAATLRGSTSFSSAVGTWDDAASPPPLKLGPDLAMPSFTVSGAVIPEPSTIALGMLGAAALLFRRRK